MCCGCCCCCKNRGKVHGYVGPPVQQPVTVTAIITQPAPTYPPTTVHYSNYPTAEYAATMPQSSQSSSRQAPPPYTEAAGAREYPHSMNDYPKQTSYNPNY